MLVEPRATAGVTHGQVDSGAELNKSKGFFRKTAVPMAGGAGLGAHSQMHSILPADDQVL